MMKLFVDLLPTHRQLLSLQNTRRSNTNSLEQVKTGLVTLKQVLYSMI